MHKFQMYVTRKIIPFGQLMINLHELGILNLDDISTNQIVMQLSGIIRE